jgi:hypothetical protein
MRTNCYYYESYQSLNDSQLRDLILAGDEIASFYLINVKYGGVLYKIVGKYLGKLHRKLSDAIEREYWLDKFRDYMNRPTKIEGKSQFEGVENKDNLKSWLCTCCENFLKNYKNIDSNRDIDPETVVADDYNAAESESEECYTNILKREMMDYFFFYLSDRDTYIMYLYLYCGREEINMVHLDEKIADVLLNHGWSDMTAEYVRKIKNKSINKAKNFFSKKIINTGKFSATFFPYIMETSTKNARKGKTNGEYEKKRRFAEENKNISDEENFLKRKKFIMLRLGIERDFTMIEEKQEKMLK